MVAALELLAPARDLACGKAAIDFGADAVYVGAPQFGAREAAGNAVANIAELARHAHRYWARAYATLNTLLRDAEVPRARRLAWDLHDAGVDGLIIQDVGLLECELPPIPLIASTQMHNHTPERVAFLEQVGFSRAILARELDLDQIRAIRNAAPRIELEFFCHGALCVCYSGQCAMSYALGGRSGNRGQCAQPCRKSYRLEDGRGAAICEDAHYLSLRDLNLSEHLDALVDAGITSFKIEGRLKDKAYVANVTAHYRQRLDAVIAARGLRRASSGRVVLDFEPDVGKTFNRGYTAHFLHGRKTPPGEPRTPKMLGEVVGKVAAIGKGTSARECALEIDGDAALRAGDGIAFFDGNRVLRGTRVNRADGRRVYVEGPDAAFLQRGVAVYRNHDHAFLACLEKSKTGRILGVVFTLTGDDRELRLRAVDEDGVVAECAVENTFERARNADTALQLMRRQLAKTGSAGLACMSVDVALEQPVAMPVAALNALRRDVIAHLAAAREAARPKPSARFVKSAHPYPERHLDFRGNVLNKHAEQFYRRHGVETSEPAAESGLDMRGKCVMTCRYCVRHQLGTCRRGIEGNPEPWFLVDDDGNRFALEFDCARCEMAVRREK